MANETDLWDMPPIDPKKNPANSILPRVKTGSRGGIRTPDMVVNSHPLCRLSYPGNMMIIPSNRPIHYKEYPLINSIEQTEFIKRRSINYQYVPAGQIKTDRV
jgi:hypothetical protein